MLTLFEDFYLVATNDNRDIAVPSKGRKIDYGLAGAILSDLALGGKIKVNDKLRLEVQDTNLTNDDILDQFFKEIMGSEHPRKVDYWVNFLASKPKKLRKQLHNRLVIDGVLKQDDSHFLWVIPSPAYPNLNCAAKFGVKEHLRTFILLCGEGDLRDLALLSLLHACKLEKLVLTKDERRSARQRMREMMTREALGNPIAQSIEDIAKSVSTELFDAAS